MRFEINEYEQATPMPHSVYLIIDTFHDILIDKFDELSDDYAYTNALERCDTLNCIYGDCYDG